MMNFVQQQDDLRDFDDQSLADELQSGRRGYHPMAVAAEMQSRLKERSDAQQQMMAQQAQQNQPVAQRQLMEFMAQAQPAQMAPEMMPPEMAMQGGMEGMPPEMMAAAMPAAMPPEMPAEAPVGIAAGMPQQMSGGGIVRRAQMGMTPESPAQRRIRITRELNEALRSGASPERIRDLKLQLEIGGAGRMSEGALRSMGLATDPRLFQPIMRTYDVKMDQPEFDLTLPQDRQAAAPAETAAETVAETRVTPTGRDVTTLPTYTPTSIDFRSAYERNLKDLQSILAPSTTEQPVSDTSFFAQERERLSKFAPDAERFQRQIQADTLTGLGAIIGGATQRGDIAKGLAQLAAQQREARRGFREEEMKYAGFESALRREERAETQAERRERRQIKREDEAAAAALRTEARQLTALEVDAQEKINNANYKVQELAQKIEIAKAEAALKGPSAQLDYLIKVLNMELIQARTQLAKAQENQININNEVESRFRSTGTSASQVRSATSGGQ